VLFLVPELRLPGLRCLPEVVDNQGSTGGQVTLNRDGVERHLVAMGVVQRGQYPAFGRPMHSPVLVTHGGQSIGEPVDGLLVRNADRELSAAWR